MVALCDPKVALGLGSPELRLRAQRHVRSPREGTPKDGSPSFKGSRRAGSGRGLLGGTWPPELGTRSRSNGGRPSNEDLRGSVNLAREITATVVRAVLRSLLKGSRSGSRGSSRQDGSGSPLVGDASGPILGRCPGLGAAGRDPAPAVDPGAVVAATRHERGSSSERLQFTHRFIVEFRGDRSPARNL
jgi:hypothetical protein